MQYNGTLDVNTIYESIPMMVIPPTAKWTANVTYTGDIPLPPRDGTVYGYGFEFNTVKPLSISAVGMDYRTSDRFTTPTRLQIFSMPGEVVYCNVMLPRDNVVDMHYYKLMITPFILPPGQYFLMIDLKDYNNLLWPEVADRPTHMALDTRINDCFRSTAFGDRFRYVRQVPNGVYGYGNYALEWGNNTVAAHCGNIWCTVVKTISKTTCNTFIGHDMRLLRSDNVVKHTNVGGKYFQLIHPKVISDDSGQNSLIGTGFGDLKIIDFPDVADMYSIEIEFAKLASTSVYINMRFEGIEIFPTYLSPVNQTLCTIKFDYHPIRIGTFDFLVQKLTGSYIQMTKLIVTKIF